MALIDVKTENGIVLARIVEHNDTIYNVQFFQKKYNTFADEIDVIPFESIQTFYKDNDDSDSDEDYVPSDEDTDTDEESLVDEEESDEDDI